MRIGTCIVPIRTVQSVRCLFKTTWLSHILGVATILRVAFTGGNYVMNIYSVYTWCITCGNVQYIASSHKYMLLLFVWWAHCYSSPVGGHINSLKENDQTVNSCRKGSAIQTNWQAPENIVSVLNEQLRHQRLTKPTARKVIVMTTFRHNHPADMTFQCRKERKREKQ